MLQSMFSGASGLRAHQTEMDVIGNNIANINTTGYKSERVNFSAALSNTLRGAAAPTGSVGGTDPTQVGLGVSVGSISSLETQGSPQYTGRALDVAIQGDGMLVLNTGTQSVYSRDGALTVDADGTLVSSGNTGYRVMGWNANPNTGTIDTTGALSSIQLPLGQWALARQTSSVTYSGNLDATTAAGTPIDTNYNIYDSLGNSHTMKVEFTKSSTTSGAWDWVATCADGTMGAGGTINFDTNGKITSGGNPTETLTLANPNGANATLNLNLDFSSMTSLAGDGQSSVSPTNQNGLPLGTLNSYTISSNGTISGTFSNGMTQAIAQIAVANFTNTGGLSKVSGNYFEQSANSGLAQTGVAGIGGKGTISSGYLEMSNVDLSTEFTNMIVAERGFQANSKIVTVSDEMLDNLISMKR